MSGEQLLQGNGSISHKQAVDKATDEYKKYKAKTLMKEKVSPFKYDFVTTVLDNPVYCGKIFYGR